MRHVPVVDVRGCSDCGSCLELCPSVFKRNEVSGSVEVEVLPEYPEDAVQEVVNCCPKDCIMWDEEG